MEWLLVVFMQTSETPVGKDVVLRGEYTTGKLFASEDACMTEGLSLMSRVLQTVKQSGGDPQPGMSVLCAKKWKFQQSWQVPEGR